MEKIINKRIMNKAMNQLHINTTNNSHNINQYHYKKKFSSINSYIKNTDLKTISQNNTTYSKLRILLPLQVNSKNISSKLRKKTIETNISQNKKIKKKLINFNNNSIYYSKHKNKTTFISSYLNTEIYFGYDKDNPMIKKGESLINHHLNLKDEDKENKVNNYQNKNRNICITNHLNTEFKETLINDNPMNTFRNSNRLSIKKLLDFQNNNNSPNLNYKNSPIIKNKYFENSKNANSIEKYKYFNNKKYNYPSSSNISYLSISNFSKKDNINKNKEGFQIPKKQLSNYKSPKQLILKNEKSEKKSTIIGESRNSKTECSIKRKLSKIKNTPKVINPKEFKIIKQIGSGSFGKIYKTIWNKNEEKYAMKITYTKSKDNILYIQEKVNLIKNFEEKTKCEGLIKIFGDTYISKGTDYYYYEIMELADRDWEQEIKNRKSHLLYYSEFELINIMSQLIKTLSLMQKNHITHRDIKLQNILLLNDMYKICDFGEARKMMQKGVIVQPARGSELYMSPIQFFALNQKVQQVQHNTYKSDVFSLGMCILFAATLSDDCLYDIREVTDMNIIRNILEKYLSERYSIGFIKLLLNFLEINEKKRPDFIILENIISLIKKNR